MLLRALSGLATWLEAYKKLAGFDAAARARARGRLELPTPTGTMCAGYMGSIDVGLRFTAAGTTSVVMHTLRALQWLAGDAIGAFISTVMANLDGAGRLRVLLGSRILGGKLELDSAMQRELDAAGAYCARYILAVNVGVSHWGVACIDGLDGLDGLNGLEPVISYYDSKRDEQTARAMHEGLVSTLPLRTASVRRVSCRQQPNDFDCGVCACVNILHLAHGADVPSGGKWKQAELDDARLFVAAQILACVDSGTTACAAATAPARNRRRVPAAHGTELIEID